MDQHECSLPTRPERGRIYTCECGHGWQWFAITGTSPRWVSVHDPDRRST